MNKPITDDFRGDTEHLRACMKALIEMEDAKCLVPHGIGGHARSLLASAYHRLAPKPKPRFLCRIAHRWRDLPGEVAQGYSEQRCCRCGMHRTIVCALGHSAESDPFWP